MDKYMFTAYVRLVMLLSFLLRELNGEVCALVRL
jgi:hypothetical protein